jgi:hypothetical protein
MSLATAVMKSRCWGRTWIVLSLFLYGAVFCSPAAATTVVQFGTAQLADLSNTIVRGTVTQIEARMHPEHHFIYTYVSLRVEEVFKGDPSLQGSEIILQELGGRIGDKIHFVSGIPTFRPGEEVLSFLEDRPDNLYRTYGMVQGKFSVELDPRTGVEILTRPGDLNEAALASLVNVTDLSPARPDGNYDAEPFFHALRELAAEH